MKKVLAIAAVLMLIPFTAFGFQMMSDNAMDDVTAQAGVSINFDVTLNATIDTVAWGDSDGVSGVAGEGGYVGFNSIDMKNVHVRARTDWLPASAGVAPNPNANLDGTFLTPGTIGDLQFLTIDVATNDDYVTAAELAADPAATRTYVHINPGTLQVSMEEMTASVALGGRDRAIDEVLGSVVMRGLQVYIAADNYVDIFAHGGAGVTMAFGLNLDAVYMDIMAWGDADGVGTMMAGNPTTAAESSLLVYSNGDYSNGAFVGLADVSINDVTVLGQLLVDVATLDLTAIGGTIPAGQTPGIMGLYATWIALHPDEISDSFVHLSFNGLQIGMVEMVGSVVLGTLDANGFADTVNGTLGDILVQNVSATVDGWTDIFAH